MIAITLKNLSFQVNHQPIFSQISYRFNPGLIHCILGQNGAGKSTLLKTLTQELTPSQGSIMWGHQPLHSLTPQSLARQRSVLAQSTELTFSFRVDQLIALGAEVQQNALAMDAIIDAVLAVCELTSLRTRDYLTLSGGEQKRVQIARVLAQIWPEDLSLDALNTLAKQRQNCRLQAVDSAPFKGRWLFLDEWTAGLDVKHQQQLAQYFRQWTALGLSIVMVVHDIALAGLMADEVLMLKSGQIFASGAVAEVLTAKHLKLGLEMSSRVEIDAESGRPLIFPWFESF
ncbi:MAG: ATP-binding cassette domain-containing protein [Gammaproteobacteria bacterium]|nr:ATP-binding cassette domain-containing protein [Gammaproteobacteria bacterium]